MTKKTRRQSSPKMSSKAARYLAQPNSDFVRPIIGIENRTPQEVFDIMCDRINGFLPDFKSFCASVLSQDETPKEPDAT